MCLQLCTDLSGVTNDVMFLYSILPKGNMGHLFVQYIHVVYTTSPQSLSHHSYWIDCQGITELTFK